MCPIPCNLQPTPHSPRIVVVGTSIGGLAVLKTILSGLPAAFTPPVVIVQHRRADPSGLLEIILRRCCVLPVCEPCDKEPIRAGRVYVAPADYHLMIEDGTFVLTTDAPVSYARPSVDVLFETAADSYGEDVIGIILTGANYDGSQGAAYVKQRGGILIVQEPAEAECAMMPEAALRLATPDYVLPIADIAPLLARLCPGA